MWRIMSETDGKNGEIKVFRMLIKLLKFNSAFPEDEIHFRNPMLILKFFIPVILAGFIPIIGTFSFLFIAVKNRITSDQVYSLSILFQFMLMYLIVFITYLSGNHFKVFLEELSKYKYGKPPHCKELCEKLDRWAFYSYYFLRVKSVIHLIYSFMTNSFCDGKNIRGDHRYICGCTIPLWFPIEIKSRIIRAILIVGGNSMDFLHYPVFFLFALLIYGSVQLIVLRVRHLKKMLSRVMENPDTEEIERKLYICIKYHSEIVELVNKLNVAGGYPLFPNYVSIPVLLAMFGYQSLKMKDVLALLKLILWFGGVSALCMIGQRLESESLSLNNSIYNLPYYKLNQRSRKNYQVFLARVSRPLNLQMKPFAKWNNDFLITVMKGCYTYFMFLFQMSRKVMN